jgi:hypothetical protein
MTRSYKLPEKRTDESNDDWCVRAAASIPAEAIVKELIAWAKRTEKKRKTPAWAVISDITQHGSGISCAIVRRFEK